MESDHQARQVEIVEVGSTGEIALTGVRGPAEGSAEGAVEGGMAPAVSAWPPVGFLDVWGAAAFFGIGRGQFYEWMKSGRLGCRGTMVNGPNGARGWIWPIADLQRQRAAMANPAGWVTGEEAAALFNLTKHAWQKWVAGKRIPEGRWGHGPTGKRCLLFPLEGLQQLKAQLDREQANAVARLEPYPDPTRPGLWRVPVASEKHAGMEALVDADDVELVRGKRWNYSSGSGGRGISAGTVVWAGKNTALVRMIMNVVDDKDRLVSHINGDRLDCRRANLVARTRSQVRRGAKRSKKWEGFEPYADPDPHRPGVVRLPIQTDLHKGMEALIDAADLPLIEGKRWNWSPGKPDPAKDGSVILAMTGTPKPSLARILLGIEDTTKLICHRNGNRLDCRRENLVVRSRREVKWASRKVEVKGGRRSTSRFKGVTRSDNGRKWYAAIYLGDKWRRLGRFRSEVDAALAYDAALRELMGEDVAGLNLPDAAEAERLRALEPVVEDGPFPPPGMVDRHEACAMFGVSISAWMVWEKKGRITCGEYHPNPDDSKGGRCKLYPKDELERRRIDIEQLGKPYADPDQAGVWRVPLKSYLAYREALIDAVDLPIVQGRNWNWSPRSFGALAGNVVLATTDRQEPLHRLITGATDPRVGADPKVRVVFANGDPLDCRRANLLVRTLAEVVQSTRKPETRAGRACSSGYKGVFFNAERGLWIAQIKRNGVHTQIGRFDDEIAAAEAYDTAARVAFGDHAFVNFPDRPSTEQAMADARSAMDENADRKHADRLRQRGLEQKLRRAVAEQSDSTDAAEPWPGAGLDRTGTITDDTARLLFDATPTVWKRWQRFGWLPAPVGTHAADAESFDAEPSYPIAAIERLLRRCAIVALPYPDPQWPDVYRLPLAGGTAGDREALIDADAVPLVQTRRWRFAPTGVGRGGEVQTMNPAENIRLHYVVKGAVGREALQIGHRNDDPFDCRRANLVERTLTDTAGNKRKQATFCGRPCTSRFKGVCWDWRRKRWLASIKKDRRKRSLGSFRDEIAAAKAYDEAARELFGEHARPNFPDGVDARIAASVATSDQRKAA